MKPAIILQSVQPTVFLRRGTGGLEQLIRVGLRNEAEPSSAELLVERNGERYIVPLDAVPAGDSSRDCFLPEIGGLSNGQVVLRIGEKEVDRKSLTWAPPRHWVVHVVQLSHHDVGYTNLASAVLREHDAFLDRVVDMAAATQSFPEDAQFRMVIEQAWSVDHYLRHAAPNRAEALIQLMRSGHAELTALFGNLTTEICGHESLARAVQHAFRIRRRHGIPIVSAHHNDVPGFSWGLCSVLTEVGVRFFCPGLPYYYSWGGLGLQSFWDQSALFRHEGPGAFWWEAPSGKRILFWSNNAGAGGNCRASLPDLANRLQSLQDKGYPYSVIRWPVSGGARDNAPYIEGYAHTIRRWNDAWAFPRLLCSTETRFYRDIVLQLPADLPVFRGELPGQDYPTGATSTAAATSVNRNNHTALMTAERLAAFAAATTDFPYPDGQIAESAEDILWHDEHTWGHHFPCGPTSQASELEKAVHAYRASANLHDVSTRALARIADHVQLATQDLHLVVFNPLPRATVGVVRTPLREIENCGSMMCAVPPAEDPSKEGYLRGMALQDRWHLHPSAEVVTGRFALIDAETGCEVPFQIQEIRTPEDAVPHAAQRFGLGQGTKCYGFFEAPSGLVRDLLFCAELPPCGYRTFRLVPRDQAPEFPVPTQGSPGSLENEFYRIDFDPTTYRVVRGVNKETGREFLDPASPHGLGDLLVRTPDAVEPTPIVWTSILRRDSGPVCDVIERTGSALGHPMVRQTITLYTGLRRIDLAVRVLKESRPLLDVHLAFPFAGSDPTFRYEGILSIMTPIQDYLPGAYSDAISVQNWVKVHAEAETVLWSSLDSSLASLGGLWPGYVSPAHTCLVTDRVRHPPMEPEAIRRAWIYSTLFCNNFGTNFAVSQCGESLFRYTFSSTAADLPDAEAAAIGWERVTPMETIFTGQPRERFLPPAGSYIDILTPEVRLLTCKRAEDGNGHIVRLWNTAPRNVIAQVRFPWASIAAARLTSLAEEDTETSLDHDGREVAVPLPPCGCVTFRVSGQLFTAS